METIERYFVYISSDDPRMFFVCLLFTVLRAAFRSLKYIHCTDRQGYEEKVG